MAISYTCDRCGAKLHHGEMWTVTEKRVGDVTNRTHLLCKSCYAIVVAVIHAAINVVKEGNDDR